MKSPMNSLNKPKKAVGTSNIKKENLFTLKEEEEDLNSADNIHMIKLATLGEKDIIGLEDCIEGKQRFCFVKCTSAKGAVNRVKLADLVKLIRTKDESGKDVSSDLLNMIAERKLVLFNQILLGVKEVGVRLGSEFELKYKNLLKDTNMIKTEQEKTDAIVALKMQGYKTNIEDIIDQNLNLFPQSKFSSQKQKNQAALVAKLFLDPMKLPNIVKSKNIDFTEEKEGFNEYGKISGIGNYYKNILKMKKTPGEKTAGTSCSFGKSYDISGTGGFGGFSAVVSGTDRSIFSFYKQIGNVNKGGLKSPSTSSLQTFTFPHNYSESNYNDDSFRYQPMSKEESVREKKIFPRKKTSLKIFGKRREPAVKIVGVGEHFKTSSNHLERGVEARLFEKFRTGRKDYLFGENFSEKLETDKNGDMPKIGNYYFKTSC